MANPSSIAPAEEPRPRHRIGEMIVDFTVRDAGGQMSAPEDVLMQTRMQLLPELEACLDAPPFDGASARAEVVEIELGDWPADPDWVQVRKRFREALWSALGPYLIHDLPKLGLPAFAGAPQQAGQRASAEQRAEAGQGGALGDRARLDARQSSAMPDPPASAHEGASGKTREQYFGSGTDTELSVTAPDAAGMADAATPWPAKVPDATGTSDQGLLGEAQGQAGPSTAADGKGDRVGRARPGDPSFAARREAPRSDVGMPFATQRASSRDGHEHEDDDVRAAGEPTRAAPGELPPLGVAAPSRLADKVSGEGTEHTLDPVASDATDTPQDRGSFAASGEAHGDARHNQPVTSAEAQAPIDTVDAAGPSVRGSDEKEAAEPIGYARVLDTLIGHLLQTSRDRIAPPAFRDLTAAMDRVARDFRHAAARIAPEAAGSDTRVAALLETLLGGMPEDRREMLEAIVTLSPATPAALAAWVSRAVISSTEQARHLAATLPVFVGSAQAADRAPEAAARMAVQLAVRQATRARRPYQTPGGLSEPSFTPAEPPRAEQTGTSSRRPRQPQTLAPETSAAFDATGRIAAAALHERLEAKETAPRAVPLPEDIASALEGLLQQMGHEVPAVRLFLRWLGVLPADPVLGAAARPAGTQPGDAGADAAQAPMAALPDVADARHRFGGQLPDAEPDSARLLRRDHPGGAALPETGPEAASDVERDRPAGATDRQQSEASRGAHVAVPQDHDPAGFGAQGGSARVSDPDHLGDPTGDRGQHDAFPGTEPVFQSRRDKAARPDPAAVQREIAPSLLDLLASLPDTRRQHWRQLFDLVWEVLPGTPHRAADASRPDASGDASKRDSPAGRPSASGAVADPRSGGAPGADPQPAKDEIPQAVFKTASTKKTGSKPTLARPATQDGASGTVEEPALPPDPGPSDGDAGALRETPAGGPDAERAGLEARQRPGSTTPRKETTDRNATADRRLNREGEGQAKGGDARARPKPPPVAQDRWPTSPAETVRSRRAERESDPRYLAALARMLAVPPGPDERFESRLAEILEGEFAEPGERLGALRHVAARLAYADGTRSPALRRQALAATEALIEESARGTSVAPQAAAIRDRAEDSGRAFVSQRAGLVLFAPYLALLFERLGLLDGKRHLTADALPRARRTLQLLGDRNTPEQTRTDPLEKLLLGRPQSWRHGNAAADPPPDTALIDGLIRAVVARWTALGQTSPEGLQDAFVRRGGSLRESEDGWRLTVDPGPFDMLLDRLPWSFGTVALPWMEMPLHVKWRDRDE